MTLLKYQNRILVAWVQPGIRCLYTRRTGFQPGNRGICLIFKTNLGGMGSKTYACTLTDIAFLFGQDIFHTGSLKALSAFLDVSFE
jgi:hypothetical protein